MSPLEELKFLDWKKILLTSTAVFGIISVGALAGYWYGTQQAQLAEELAPASQPTPTPKPTPTPEETSETEPSVGYPNYNIWKSVEDDFWGIRFKIPADQEYNKARRRVEPSGVTLNADGYGGGSRRQYVLKMHRLTERDIFVQDYTTMKGLSALLIEGVTDSARAEGLRYEGVITKGSDLLVVYGTKEDDSLIKGILDTLEFGRERLIPNTVGCTKFDPDWEEEYGRRENGDYYFNTRFTRKMDESYIRNSEMIFIKAVAQIDYDPETGATGETLVRKPVNFSVELTEYDSPPYVQKLTLVVSKNEVVAKIGQEILDEADGISLWIYRRGLKTADGIFCSGESTVGTTTIK